MTGLIPPVEVETVPIFPAKKKENRKLVANFESARGGSHTTIVNESAFVAKPIRAKIAARNQPPYLLSRKNGRK